MSVSLGCYKVDAEAKFPMRGTEDSACYDIYACLHNEEVKMHDKFYPHQVEKDESGKKFFRLNPGDMALVPTGIIFCLPPTHHMKIYSRSGNVWKKLLTVANQPAIIDSDYTHETFVLLHNMSNRIHIIEDGDAVAQAELCENGTIDFHPVDDNEFAAFVELIKLNSSRDGGLGHTGR